MAATIEEYRHRRAKNGFAARKKELINLAVMYKGKADIIRRVYPDANDTPENMVIEFKDSIRELRLALEELETITHPFKTGGHH